MMKFSQFAIYFVLILLACIKQDLSETYHMQRYKCVQFDNRRHCLMLLGDRHSHVTWDAARAHCSTHDGRLAQLHNRPMIKAVRALTRTIKTGDNSSSARAWIGAKRIPGPDHWFTVGGFRHGVRLTGYCYQGFCGRIEVATSHVTSCRCEVSDGHYALCSYASQGSRCLDNDYEHGSICYHVSAIAMTWFEASTYCTLHFPSGKLSVTFLDFVIHGFQIEVVHRTMPRNSYLWIGLTRKPWIWLDDFDNASPVDVIRVFNWVPGEGQEISHTSPMCVAVDANHNGAWVDTGCNDLYPYFICETVDDTTLTATTELTTWSTVSTETLSSSDWTEIYETLETRIMTTRSPETPITTTELERNRPDRNSTLFGKGHCTELYDTTTVGDQSPAIPRVKYAYILPMAVVAIFVAFVVIISVVIMRWRRYLRPVTSRLSRQRKPIRNLISALENSTDGKELMLNKSQIAMETGGIKKLYHEPEVGYRYVTRTSASQTEPLECISQAAGTHPINSRANHDYVNVGVRENATGNEFRPLKISNHNYMNIIYGSLLGIESDEHDYENVTNKDAEKSTFDI